MRIAALDVGDARIGVAVSDELGITAQGIGVVQRVGGKRDLEALAQMLGPYAPERVVVGLPLGLSGADTDQTREARAWADRLAAAVPVPVELYDERFTTAIAARSAGDRTSEDSRAAAVLLEDWLAHHEREVAG